MWTIFDSVGTIVGKRYVASFPAVGTVIQTVYAQVDVMLAFANGAVFFAAAILFRLVTHRTDDRTLHGSPPRKLYLRHAGAASGRTEVSLAFCPSLLQKKACQIRSQVAFFDDCKHAC
jgi:hypothetical protein